MNHKITLGSLFDGAGGFPYAGTLAGITPRWMSEIEPFPIRVTTRRFPDVKHLGSVTDINGAEIEPVDIVTFGSPCQDLSIAGKRAGLDGERSGLFMEAVRIIKEMREATHGEYPKYAVWENVHGAFSSNKGEDFRIVLKQLAGVKRPEISIPKPDKGKWLNAGEIVGDDFSIAWRTVDAQYWGTAQRRKRIYLVADFDGQSAGEVQFKSDRLYWDTQESSGEGKRTAGTAESDIGTSGERIICLNDQGGNQMDVSESMTGTLRAQTHGHPPIVVYGLSSKASNAWRSNNPHSGCCEADTVRTLDTGAGNPTRNQDGNIVVQSKSYSIGDGQTNSLYLDEKARTLKCGGGNLQGVIVPSSDYPYIARRLVPLECCRLQGFPDWWCDDLATENPTDEEIDWWAGVFETHRKAVNPNGKPKSRNQIKKWLQNPQTDSAEYKMWGNSLAIPNAYHVLKGIAEQLQGTNQKVQTVTNKHVKIITGVQMSMWDSIKWV